MRRKWIGVLLAVAISLIGLAVVAQEGGGPLNIAFIFDASGSMMAGMEGRTRLAVAQDAMSSLSAGLPANANASLWVYGHRLSQDDPAASCQDIEEVIPLAPLDTAQFEAAVRGLNAIGYTPITTSLQLAAQTLVDRPEARNTIVLISDGEETCGGSPCLMAQALKQANIELTVNTIGFAADDVTREQLECIADVTGGTYYDAPDAVQLEEALSAAVTPPGSVQIIDALGNALPEVAFTLEAVEGGVSMGDFVGSASVPPGDYRATVRSDPPLETTVTVESEENTFIALDVMNITGIQMVNLAGEPLPDLNFSLVDPATGETLYGTGVLELPPGDYHIVVSTAFPQEYDVTVPDGSLVPVSVDDAAGLIRIVNLAGEPLPEMYFNVIDPITGEAVYGQGEMFVPPGTYPVQVRTAFETLAEATVGDDQTVDVPVNDAEGLIRIVNLAGEPLPGMDFNVVDPVSGETVYGQGEMRVPPGTYPVEVQTAFPTAAEATVEDDQTVDVPVDTAVGTIVLVDLFGEPLSEAFFDLTDPRTGEQYYAQGQIDAPPGTYTVHVSVEPPVDIEVTLADGQILEVPVNNEVGTVRIIDPAGNVISELSFSATEHSTGTQEYGSGELVLPPGQYEVRVDFVFPITTSVEVRAGEVTDIAVDNAVGTVQLVDEQGQPLNDLALEVWRADDNQSVYGRGPLQVPPGDYHLQVQTGIEYQTDIAVVANQTTEVVVPSTGTIQLVNEAGNPINDLLYSITRSDTGENTAVRGPLDVPPGDYQLTIHTAIEFETDIAVVAGQTTEVVVPSTGTIQLVNEAGNPINDLLYSILRVETGQTTAVRGPLDVPPGDYQLTIHTAIEFETEISVVAGETTEVAVPSTGTIQLVNEAGNPINDLLYSVTRVETGQTTAVRGPLDAPPGSYELEIFTVFPFEVEVEVVAGQTTEVTVNLTSGTIQLADENGAPLNAQLYTYTRVDTGESSSAQGPVELPPGTYTVEVFTVFPFEVEVEVVAGQTTEVTVDTTAGTIQLVDEDGDPLNAQLYTYTRVDSGEGSSAQGPIELPPGTYELEIYTVFPFEVEVEVVAGETAEVTVDTTAGTLQIVDEDGAPLNGQLFSYYSAVHDTGSSAQGSVDLPPGTYALEIYTVFPFEVEVEVIAEETTEVVVNTSAGTLQMVDGRGRPQPSVLFTVTQDETGGQTSAIGEIDLPPGIYTVSVLADKSFEIDVEVIDDEITTVDVMNQRTNQPAP